MLRIAEKQYKWAVVGAGPAGIAVVGRLLDEGIKPSEILWADPQILTVGLLGRKWSSILSLLRIGVSSNTTVKLFIDFLNASPSFDYHKVPTKFAIHNLNPTDTCKLSFVVEPLKWVAKSLRDRVVSREEIVSRVSRGDNGEWVLVGEQGLPIATSKNVVLAIGSRAKEPNFGFGDVPIIPLEEALQIEVLANQVTPQDTVAVFGSSHSAIMIVRDLLRMGTNVVNFYRSPLVYAVYLPGGKGIVNDSTGLKGNTAKWAKENISSSSLPPALSRFVSNDENIQAQMKRCTKVIYAIGFERESISIDGMDEITYDASSGKISEGLFGAGIAFPELGADAVGNMEHQVGLWKFMRYLTRVVPTWCTETPSVIGR